MAQHLHQPGRVQQSIANDRQARLDRRHKSIAHITFTIAVYRHIHRDNQMLHPSIMSAANQVFGDALFARHVQLKPGLLRCRLRGRFNRRRARAGQHERYTRVVGRASQHQISAMPGKAGQTSRCHAQRHVVPAAQQSPMQAQLRHIDQVVRQQGDMLKSIPIAAQAGFVVHATVDVVKHQTRQITPGCFAQASDVVTLIQT